MNNPLESACSASLERMMRGIVKEMGYLIANGLIVSSSHRLIVSRLITLENAQLDGECPIRWRRQNSWISHTC